MSAFLTPDLSYGLFRRFVDERVPDGSAHIKTFSLNRRNEDASRRFWCPDHAWVVPHGNRFDCPYCMPASVDPPPAKVVSIDRSTGMVALNAS